MRRGRIWYLLARVAPCVTSWYVTRRYTPALRCLLLPSTRASNAGVAEPVFARQLFASCQGSAIVTEGIRVSSIE